MPDPRVKVVIEAVDNASKQIESISRRQLQHIRRFGLELTLLGGAMTVFGLKAISAGQEGANAVSRLQMALDYVGDSSIGAQKAIDATLTAWSGLYGIKKTDLQTELNDLIFKTGNLKVALQELQAGAILAKVGKLPLHDAIELLDKALTGDQGAIAKVRELTGLVLDPKKGAAGLDSIIIDLGKAAEDATSPMEKLKVASSNLFAVLGGGGGFNILSMVVGKLADFARWVADIAANHPALVGAIFNIFLALGLLAVIAGTLITALATLGIMLMALPLLLTAVGIAVDFALGPIGLITLAIFGLIAAGILLGMFWQEIWGFLKDLVTGDAGWIGIAILAMLGPIGWIIIAMQQVYQHWRGIWNGMKGIAETVINFVIDAVETLVNSLSSALNAISRFLHLPEIPRVTLPRIAITDEQGLGRDLGEIPGASRRIVPGTLGALPIVPMTIMPGPAYAGPGPAGTGVFNLNFNGPVYGMDDFNKQVAEAVRMFSGRGGFDNLFAVK